MYGWNDIYGSPAAARQDLFDLDEDIDGMIEEEYGILGLSKKERAARRDKQINNILGKLKRYLEDENFDKAEEFSEKLAKVVAKMEKVDPDFEISAELAAWLDYAETKEPGPLYEALGMVAWTGEAVEAAPSPDGVATQIRRSAWESPGEMMRAGPYLTPEGELIATPLRPVLPEGWQESYEPDYGPAPEPYYGPSAAPDWKRPPAPATMKRQPAPATMKRQPAPATMKRQPAPATMKRQPAPKSKPKPKSLPALAVSLGQKIGSKFTPKKKTPAPTTMKRQPAPKPKAKLLTPKPKSLPALAASIGQKIGSKFTPKKKFGAVHAAILEGVQEAFGADVRIRPDAFQNLQGRDTLPASFFLEAEVFGQDARIRPDAFQNLQGRDTIPASSFLAGIFAPFDNIDIDAALAAPSSPEEDEIPKPIGTRRSKTEARFGAVFTRGTEKKLGDIQRRYNRLRKTARTEQDLLEADHLKEEYDRLFVVYQKAKAMQKTSEVPGFDEDDDLDLLVEFPEDIEFAPASGSATVEAISEKVGQLQATFGATW